MCIHTNDKHVYTDDNSDNNNNTHNMYLDRLLSRQASHGDRDYDGYSHGSWDCVSGLYRLSSPLDLQTGGVCF